MYPRAGLDAVAKVVVLATFRNPKVESHDLSFVCALAKQL